MQIFIHRNDKNEGPYDLLDMQEFVAAGQLTGADMAWYEGAPGWMPLAQVPGVILPAGTYQASAAPAVPAQQPVYGAAPPHVAYGAQGGQAYPGYQPVNFVGAAGAQEPLPNWLAIVSALFPCVGLVAFIVFLYSGKKLRAKTCGTWLLIGTTSWLLFIGLINS